MKLILVVVGVLIIGFVGWSMMNKDAKPAMEAETAQEPIEAMEPETNGDDAMMEEDKEMMEGEEDAMMEEEDTMMEEGAEEAVGY